MRVTMNRRYPIRMQYLDSGNATNFTSPSPSTAPADPPKSNAFSPAVVAVIGVLAGAFLIVSYYRIFLRYCNGHHFTFWGPRSDARNGGPSTIVLMEEHAWPAESLGLDEALIGRIPTCKYKADEGLVDGTECSVCLGEFEEGEELRILPKCNHPFHIPCIDKWLASSSTCPLCRVNIVLAASTPYALMPVGREPPAAARGPAASFTPASHANPVQALITHEIEILQEHHAQEFLEPGQLSGPSSRASSRASSPASFLPPPESVDQTPDSRQGDSMQGRTVQHIRHLSLETDSSTTTREIHVVNDSQASSEVVTTPAPASVSKRRLYNRARSSGHRHRSDGGFRVGDHKGKHPIHPLSSPQRAHSKRFAKLLGSRSTAGSSSLNQVVVELLAQEIFQNNVCTSTQSTEISTIVETSVRTVSRVRSAKEEPSTSTSVPSSQRPPKVRHDNASFEVMWSINEQENPLMGSSSSFHYRLSSSERIEVDSPEERFPDSLQLSSDPNSDCDEDGHPRSTSLKRSMTKDADNVHTGPSKRHSFRTSMVKLSTKCGSVNIRQSSFRQTEKVHASEPVFEIFDF